MKLICARCLHILKIANIAQAKRNSRRKLVNKMGALLLLSLLVLPIANSQTKDAIINDSVKIKHSLCPYGDKCECKECTGEKCDGCHRHFDVPFNLNSNPSDNVSPNDTGINNRCIKYRPFCADGVLTFQTTVCPYCNPGTSGVCNVCAAQNPDRINYGCLFSQPRPAWFVMKVKTAGKIDINVASDDVPFGNNPGSDIDIAIWGPFDSPTEACENYFYGQSPVRNADGTLACSYSTKHTETLSIQEAVAGKYYIMIITNYRNRLSNVSITQPNKGRQGAGELDCDMVYECSLLAVTANTTECNGGKYSVSGVVDFTNAPATGRLCITNTACRDTFFINPPYNNQTSFRYHFDNLTCDGNSQTLRAWFEADADCSIETSYTAVADFCPHMTISSANGSICEGDSVAVVFNFENVNLPSTYKYTYNGTTHTVNNFIGSTDTLWVKENATITAVSISNAECASGQALGNVTVSVRPMPNAHLEDVEICSGVYTFNCGVGGSAYSYLWKKIENGEYISIGTLSTYRASLSGMYKVTVTNKVTGCSKSDSASLIIHSETKPSLVANPESTCAGATINLTASSTSDRVVAYNFYKNDRNVQSGEENTYSEDNYATESTYTATTTFSVDDKTCESAASDPVTVAIAAPDALQINVPANVNVYKDENCFADTDTSKTGVATVTSSGCSNSSNTTITYTDSDAPITMRDGNVTSNPMQTIIRTWTARNIYTNASVSGAQTIYVYDTIAPTFNVPEGVVVSKDENCEYNINPNSLGTITNLHDNCTDSAHLVVNHEDVIDGSMIFRTWTVVDASGNSTSKIQTITIEDKIGPRFTPPATVVIPSNENCEYNASPEITGTVTDAEDNCTPANEIVITYVDSLADNRLIRIWKATDASGNFSQKEQIIIIEDETAPTISTLDSALVYSDANCNANVSPDVLGRPTVSDNCTATENIRTEYKDVRRNKIITRTWTATDAAGNKAVSKQIITIVDTIAPIFVAPADTTIYKNENCEYNSFVPNVTATDNCSSSNEIEISYNDLQMENSIARTWTAIDASGNTTNHIQIITIADTMAPKFVAPANVTLYKDANCEYNADTTVTGTLSSVRDNCTDAANIAVSYSDEFDANKIIRTWIAKDANGNASRKQQIISIIDTIAPTFTVPADTTISSGADCACNANPEISGNVVDANDNCTSNDNLNISHNDLLVGTTLLRTWTVTDADGNATSHSQTINIVDKISPTFTAPADITIYRNANCQYNDAPEYTGNPTDIADNCSSIDNIDVEYFDYSEENLIARTWILTDASQNSISKIQYITLADTLAPVLTSAQNLDLECDGNGNIAAVETWLAAHGNATASDCDTLLTWTNNYSTDGYSISETCTANRTQLVTFTVTDESGNTATTSATISILDTQAPEITSNPKDLKVFCSDANFKNQISEWIANNGGLSATDVCSDVTYSNNYPELNIDLDNICNNSTTPSVLYPVEFAVADACGNTVRMTATLEIVTSRENIIVVRNYERVYGDNNFSINAMASSNLPVEMKIVSGSSISLTHTDKGSYSAAILSAGVTVVEATQSGSDKYSEATPVRFTVTINKAKLSISVRDESVKVGESVPQFLVIYKGFVYGETDSVLIQKPQASLLSANLATDSDYDGISGTYLNEGLYTIAPQGGEASNYVFEYVNGTLEVYESNGSYKYNAFTPNNDGLNDIFGEGKYVRIYTNLGVKIFDGEDGWSGINNRTGEQVESGTYYYILIDREKGKSYKGSVEVLK